MYELSRLERPKAPIFESHRHRACDSVCVVLLSIIDILLF